MVDCWRWWMWLPHLVGCLAGETAADGDKYAQVRFTRTATLWSVKGFRNVELPMDLGLFDHSCQQMEALLRTRKPQSKLQSTTLNTTSLAARRVCATIENWPHWFRSMKQTGGTHKVSGKKVKRQLLIGTALGTVFGRSSGARFPTGYWTLRLRTRSRNSRRTFTCCATTLQCWWQRSRRDSTMSSSSRRLSRN